MEKQELSKNLVEGDIILVSEKGLKHAFNRALGRSRWHHVMLYLGKGRVLEVTPKKGCHISILDLTKSCYIRFKAIRNTSLTLKQRKKLAEDAVKLFHGRNFSWRQLTKVFFRRVVDIKSNIRKSVMLGQPSQHHSKKIICSNTIAMLYYKAGCLISERHNPEYIMPRDYDRAKGFEVIFEKKL